MTTEFRILRYSILWMLSQNLTLGRPCVYISPAKFRLLLSQVSVSHLPLSSKLPQMLFSPCPQLMTTLSSSLRKTETRSRELPWAPHLFRPLLPLARRLPSSQGDYGATSVLFAKPKRSACAPDPTGLWTDDVKPFILCSWIPPQSLDGVFSDWRRWHTLKHLVLQNNMACCEKQLCQHSWTHLVDFEPLFCYICLIKLQPPPGIPCPPPWLHFPP